MIDSLQTSPLSPVNFGFVRDLVYREAGIVLDQGKEYLVETRLSAVAIAEGFASVNALVEQLRIAGASPAITRTIVDALTTNETLFFRDLNPFDAMREQVIPQFRAARPGTQLQIWSAACSTGQESYSLAMLLAEHFPDLDYRITATDICTSVLARARQGKFSQIEINRGLPAKYLVKYFRQEGASWLIDARLRQRIDFREMNLTSGWPVLPTFHVVFLRNVMIYFDLEARRRILRLVRGVLAPGGHLVLGGAETTVMLDPTYRPVQIGRTTFYQA